MVMDKQGVEKMVQDLSKAIKEGNIENAQNIAGKLAEKKAIIDMMYEPPDETRDKMISVKIQIENKERSTVQPLEWVVKVSTKIVQLKRLLRKEKGFPESYQRWIVGKRIAVDTASLSSCGVSEDGHTVFVYIMSHKPRTVHPGLEDEHTFDIPNIAGDNSGPVTMPAHLSQPPARREGRAPTPQRTELPFATMPAAMGGPEGGARSMDARGGSMDTSPGTQGHRMQIGWNCPRCTFLNQPQNRRCYMCDDGRRPPDYIVPEEYRFVPETQGSQSSNETLRNDESASPHQSEGLPDIHQPQRFPDGHQPPQRPHDVRQSQRPHDSHQPPQRPHDIRQSQRPQHDNPPQPHERDTHRPQRPSETSTTGPLAAHRDMIMVYNHDTMNFDYVERPPEDI